MQIQDNNTTNLDAAAAQDQGTPMGQARPNRLEIKKGLRASRRGNSSGKSFKTIKGQKYKVYPNGILVPETLVREGVSVKKPQDVQGYLADLADQKQECVVVLTLDGHHQVLKRHIVTLGLANQSQIHPRETFRPAIVDGAVAIMVAHNHPSGNLQPSEADLAATRRLNQAGQTLGIPMLDHLIFSVTGIYSIREHYPSAF